MELLDTIKIFVLDKGFIYVGILEEDDGDKLIIKNAHAIIKWGTTKHLAELVNGPLDNTKIGDSCSIYVKWSSVVHIIEVNQNAWEKYTN